MKEWNCRCEFEVLLIQEDHYSFHSQGKFYFYSVEKELFGPEESWN